MCSMLELRTQPRKHKDINTDKTREIKTQNMNGCIFQEDQIHIRHKYFRCVGGNRRALASQCTNWCEVQKM